LATSSISAEIYSLLYGLGARANSTSFFHTAYAVHLAAAQPQKLLLVTKWLYPEVASRYHTSWQAVERNIRTVIAICWAEDDGAKMNRLMGCTFSKKPSPTQLIQALAFYLLQKPDTFW
jgi:two-component system response regulator (stage 0 sporulation protein A)